MGSCPYEPGTWPASPRHCACPQAFSRSVRLSSALSSLIMKPAQLLDNRQDLGLLTANEFLNANHWRLASDSGVFVAWFHVTFTARNVSRSMASVCLRRFHSRTSMCCVMH